MIKRSEYSQRQVENMAGFSRGYLSQLLAQNLDLKVWHLLAILDLFDESPTDFFARLWPRDPGSARGDSLRRFAESSAPPGDEIVESLERLYRVSVDSLGRLRERLERYDGALEELEAKGLVRPPKTE
ncbi:MAG: hypothetical protein AAF725_08975 [Acidobacteriota bacterium]